MTVWCPRCGRGYAVTADRPEGGDWRSLASVFVAPMAARRDDTQIRS